VETDSKRKASTMMILTPRGEVPFDELEREDVVLVIDADGELAERKFLVDSITLEPGDSHPLHPEWKVEKILHSPTHTDLMKYQWVRRDGRRATLMGWIPSRRHVGPYWSPKGSNVGTDFDIEIANKHIETTDDSPDATMTVRWFSWSASGNWPPIEGSRPIVWRD